MGYRATEGLSAVIVFFSSWFLVHVMCACVQRIERRLGRLQVCFFFFVCTSRV